MSDLTRQWVVVELSHHGEKKTAKELQQLLSNELGPVEVFVPSVTFSHRESDITICLMEGYFFIEAGLPTATYFDLEELLYIKRVLTNDEPSGRFLCYVGQETVDELHRKLQSRAARDIRAGDYVRVVEGAYSALRGQILDVFPDSESATIHIVDLKSMEVIVELPFQFFEQVFLHDDELENG